MNPVYLSAKFLPTHVHQSALTYSVREAAALLGIGNSTLYDAINRGEVVHVRIGKRVVIPRWVVDRMLSPAAKDHAS